MYFTGCNHHCEGCHNKLLQTYKMGIEVSPTALLGLILEYCRRNDTKKVVFLGGDAMFKPNL